MARHYDQEHIEGWSSDGWMTGSVGCNVIFTLEPGDTAWTPEHPQRRYTGTGEMLYRFHRDEAAGETAYRVLNGAPWRSCVVEHADTVTLTA